MKTSVVLGAFALSLTVSTAMAADMPASAPPPPAPVAVVADPIAPIGAVVTTVVDGVIVAPLTAIGTIFAPPPPPPAPVVARY